jgi:hypothetical protein
MTNDANSVGKQVKVIVIGLLIATFSLFAATSFRDWVDSVLQVAVPIGERSLSGGGMIVAYRACYFLIILALLVAVTVCFLPT